MKAYDPQMAARVWQRVQNPPTETASEPTHREAGLQGLIMEEWISASTYLQLSRQLPGKEASVLQRLFREEQTHASCLRGIYTLITGEKPPIQTPPTVKEPAETTLRKCYGREMRSLKEYEARSSDPEFGPVFAKLAEQEREHCRAVLELIGGLQKK